MKTWALIAVLALAPAGIGLAQVKDPVGWGIYVVLEKDKKTWREVEDPKATQAECEKAAKFIYDEYKGIQAVTCVGLSATDLAVFRLKTVKIVKIPSSEDRARQAAEKARGAEEMRKVTEAADARIREEVKRAAEEGKKAAAARKEQTSPQPAAKAVTPAPSLAEQAQILASAKEEATRVAAEKEKSDQARDCASTLLRLERERVEDWRLHGISITDDQFRAKVDKAFSNRPECRKK